MSTQRKNHGNPSLGDIVRTTAVMSALILGLAGLAWLFGTGTEVERRDVDYQSALVSAQRDASFDLLAPEQLPSGWRANTVRYEAGEMGRWHLGVITDEEEYIGLEQTPVSVSSTVEEYSPDTEARGEVSIGGFDWELRTSERGETSLVRRADDVTVLVTGTAPQDVIETYAASLVSD